MTSLDLGLIGNVKQEQEDLPSTPILVTQLFDAGDSGIEITDAAPRFHRYDRMFCPMALVRQIAGNPRVRIRLQPSGFEPHAGQLRGHGGW